MYSFAPLVDQSNNHLGFYLVMAVFFFLTFLFSLPFDTLKGKLIQIAICISLFAYPFQIAFNESYTPHHPLNEKCVGTFVRYIAEVSGGKHHSHNVYVVYNVDGNDVLLRANEGASYPKQAVLYKN